MKLIALIGLVSVEKIELTIELAEFFRHKTVTIIDNIARMRIDPVHLGGEKLIRINGDITDQLAGLIEGDIVIAAISETVNLENLIVTLEELREKGVEVVTLGLIDLRTCDCFPQTRQVIELYADVVVNLPYELDNVVEALDNR